MIIRKHITNETTGFKLYLTIFNEKYGKLEIGLETIIVNLGENINQGVIPYADIGTDSSIQLRQVQSNYGEDIRTPIFTDIDPTTHKIRVGIYAVGTNKPVIVKNCTIHQTHDTIDTHDIDIVWEANVVTFSEENTTSALQFINMNWGRTFSPILWMMNPEGSYSDSQVRKWRLEYNGFVPAPAKYEADQGYVLYADGTWGPIKGIIRNRTFTVTPSTDSSSTQTNDYAITEGAEDLAIVINENYSVDINIVFSGLGTKNNTNTTLRITGVTGTINLYDCSGNPIKYITDGMSMKCTIFKNTIDDPVESMNAYCMYDIVSYPNTINGPSE